MSRDFVLQNIKELSIVADTLKIRYNVYVAHRYPQQGGGVNMEVLISFLVAVLAGVICHLICKWLDSNDKGNK